MSTRGIASGLRPFPQLNQEDWTVRSWRSVHCMFLASGVQCLRFGLYVSCQGMRKVWCVHNMYTHTSPVCESFARQANLSELKVVQIWQFLRRFASQFYNNLFLNWRGTPEDNWKLNSRSHAVKLKGAWTQVVREEALPLKPDHSKSDLLKQFLVQWTLRVLGSENTRQSRNDSRKEHRKRRSRLLSSGNKCWLITWRKSATSLQLQSDNRKTAEREKTNDSDSWKITAYEKILAGFSIMNFVCAHFW